MNISYFYVKCVYYITVIAIEINELKAERCSAFVVGKVMEWSDRSQSIHAFEFDD